LLSKGISMQNLGFILKFLSVLPECPC
jgi:hypothetical protein